MKDQNAIITSVLKKLSALRVTLPDEEQAVLDALVIQEVEKDEVSAHIATQTKADVMKMDVKKADVQKIDVNATPNDDETSGHIATQTKADVRRVDIQKADVKKIDVLFDPEKGRYIISVR